jgi:hypothetical protein
MVARSTSGTPRDYPGLSWRHWAGLTSTYVQVGAQKAVVRSEVIGVLARGFESLVPQGLVAEPTGTLLAT